MGLLLKAVGGGLVVASVKIITRKIEKQNEHKELACWFDGEISEEEFYVMVKRGVKGVANIKSLSAEGTEVHVTVKFPSDSTDSSFRIDFNDHGELTGNYWISANKKCSGIAKTIAEKIARQIKRHPEYSDDAFDEEVYQEELEVGLREIAEAYCPFCGKQNPIENAKFCAHCGMRFRV